MTEVWVAVLGFGGAFLGSAGLVVAGWIAHRSSTRAAAVTAQAQEAAAVVAAEPSHREQDRAAFEAITSHLAVRVQRSEDAVQVLQDEVAELKEGRAEDGRKIAALVRYLRKTLAALRLHDIPPPVPDPGDEAELARHGLP